MTKPSILFTLLMATASVTACGGGDGNEPVTVARSAASYDISGNAVAQRSALASAGVEVISTKCYPGEKSKSPQVITDDRPTAVLYVHEIKNSDLDAAMAAGLKPDYSTDGFSKTERSCESDKDIPASDIPASDIPAQDIPAQDIPAQK